MRTSIGPRTHTRAAASLGTALAIAVCTGLAIAPTWAKPVAPVQTKPAAQPWLGVGIEQGRRGVRITEIIAGTPADDAGLLVGDELVAIGGVPTTTPPALMQAVAAHAVGDRIDVALWRGVHRVNVSATLAAKLSDAEILRRRLQGKSAPSFDLPAIRGDQSGNLEELAGDVVIVEFWATWCRECASTHRALSDFAIEHEAQGAAVLAISREPAAQLSRWTQNSTYAFTVLHDRNGAATSAYFADRAQLPLLVVIDGDGEIAYAGLGASANVDHALFTAERLLRSRSRWRR